MTYKEFRDKYNGKWVDYDGAYGCQCRLGSRRKIFY